MIYTREFWLQAVHFNGADAYEDYRWSQTHTKDGDWRKAAVCLERCLHSVHGHNFRIVIECEGELTNDIAYFVDDIELASVVREWDNVNLSLLPEFQEYGWRATTERMAMLLTQKLRRRWSSVHFTVQVWETNDISACASSKGETE